MAIRIIGDTRLSETYSMNIVRHHELFSWNFSIKISLKYRLNYCKKNRNFAA